MKVSRKREQMWHFAEPEHCGWAQTFAEKEEFDETIFLQGEDLAVYGGRESDNSLTVHRR
jgi:hypothetical protein